MKKLTNFQFDNLFPLVDKWEGIIYTVLQKMQNYFIFFTLHKCLRVIFQKMLPFM